MLNQCCPVFNALFLADFDKWVHLTFGFSGFDQQVGAELDAIAGQDFLDFEGILHQRLPQKSCGGFHALVVVQFQVNIARSPVDGDKKIVLVFASVDWGAADGMELARRALPHARRSGARAFHGWPARSGGL